MRPIKFRAWDTLYNEMIYDVQFRRDDRTFDNFLDSRYALMQFTGKKDKNGKEIWEGDRVKCVWVLYYYLKTVLGTVKFIDGCWDVVFDEKQYDPSLKCYRERDYVKCFTVNHAIEVIGNIYESPELLSNP